MIENRRPPDRSMDCYSRALAFALRSNAEVSGTEVERVERVDGARMDVAGPRLECERAALGFSAATMLRDPDAPARRVRVH
jgi:hypothetical protein